MVRTFLVRGMLVGIVAGLLSFAFLKIYGEPQVDRAIAFEEQMDEAKAEFAKHHGMAVPEEQPELVSRPVQAGLGLFVAVMVYSAAFGGLFGLVFAFAQGRMSIELSPQGLAALLALIGFIAIYLVPNLKYPANPPSVGNPETIGTRTALYFGMIGVSLIAMIGAVNLRRMLTARYGAWNATLMVAAYYVVVMIVAGLLLPAVNEVPDEFPAVILWKFRIASLAAQLIMWTTLGLLFGALTQRAMAVRRA
jgi:predicted cobalt transporter CbtA